jgi:hypothetical protein
MIWLWGDTVCVRSSSHSLHTSTHRMVQPHFPRSDAGHIEYGIIKSLRRTCPKCENKRVPLTRYDDDIYTDSYRLRCSHCLND